MKLIQNTEREHRELRVNRNYERKRRVDTFLNVFMQK